MPNGDLHSEVRSSRLVVHDGAEDVPLFDLDTELLAAMWIVLVKVAARVVTVRCSIYEATTLSRKHWKRALLPGGARQGFDHLHPWFGEPLDGAPPRR